MMDTYKQLTKDFPKEALSKDSSRGFDLTSIKAQYIKERLNEVFGIYGWEVTGKYEKDGENILYFGELRVTTITYHDNGDVLPEQIKEETRSVESVGCSAIKRNLGDAYKSAQTDFLSKAASFIGIGNEVFKGNVNLNNYKTPIKQPQNTSSEAQKPASRPVYDVDPGAYIIKTAADKKGSLKLQGKRLDKANFNLLKSCCDYWTGRDIDGALKQDIEKMNEYIRYIRTQQELGLKI